MSMDSTILVCLSLIMQCWAFSMMKVMRLLGFIVLNDNMPSRVLMHFAAVIVCRVGKYDSRSNNIIIIL